MINMNNNGQRHLPSTLRDDVDQLVTDPLKNISTFQKDYMTCRQLPGLDSLHLHQQEEDYVRIKFSGMSVCVSPNSPRGGSTSQERACSVNEYSPPPSSMTHKPSLVYDPIRSSLHPPLPLGKMIHPDQRRHSIANLDSTRSVNLHSHELPPLPQQHQSFPGHYSAPSSPPLLHQKSLKHSPYARKKSISTQPFLDDDPPLLKTIMRCNSSAVIYDLPTTATKRRMSMNHACRNNHIGKTFDETTEEERQEETEGLYSRSPELRISHKLAERKRRKEMKDLFEELRNTLPVDKALKTSKWEILSKAVEYIGLLRHKDYTMEQELLMLKHELESLKSQNNTYPTN